MLVKFASLCDKCGARSEEYTPWPSCEDCGDQTCTACMARITREADYQQPELCLCKHCSATRAVFDGPEIPSEARP